MGKHDKARRRARHLPVTSLLLAQVSLTALLWATGSRADALTASDFVNYNAATAASIQPGLFALYQAPVNSLIPTQFNAGLSEVATKTAGFNLDTPSNLTADLLTDIEPVVIGPGGVLYQTNGHHTFLALTNSIYGASNPNVFIDIIANFSGLTETEFFAAMQNNNFLYPVDNGSLVSINPATGAPLPSSLSGLTNDPYRALEYRVLKNKGAAGAGFDKTSAFFSDFIWADAYRGANGGLGLPVLSPNDWNRAAAWSSLGTNTTTLPVFGNISVAQLPGFILPGSIVISGVVSDATLANGVLDGSRTGTFDQATTFASFTGLEGLNLGPVTVGATSPGFVMQLGNDAGGTVTLLGPNTYTGGTTILAGTLVAGSDGALGAAPTSQAIDPNNVQASVQADNGILFNSLSEGAGTLQFGATAGAYTSSSPFVSARPIAIGGEIAELDLNGNTVKLTGPLASYAESETGVSALSIEDLSANADGVLILAPTGGSPNFFGNIILSGGTLEVASDAALGNTVGPANQIGVLDLDGGTFKPTASFASVRSLLVTSGSVFDTNGTATSFAGTLADDQRTLSVINSAAGTNGTVAFGRLDLGSTVNLTVTAATGGGSTAVTFTDGITREGTATLFLLPTSGTLGTTEQVLSGVAPTVTNGIVAPWLLINDGASNNPYDFATYGADGYTAATYTSTNIASAAATDVVKQGASVTLAGDAQAYALNLQKGFNVTVGTGHTLTLGDGTDPAGLILNGGSGSGLTGGTLAFNGSEGVIAINGSSTITSQITGSGGLTLAGSGTLTLGTASTETGRITLDSGTLTLTAANAFANSTTGIMLDDVKKTPAPSILALSASNAFAAVDSAGNNSTITLASGTTLTIGDTATNLDSTLESAITESGSATAGAITKDGSGLLDLSSISKGKLSLIKGSSIVVNGGELRLTSTTFKNNSASSNNIITVNAGTEVQFDEKGGGLFAGSVQGAGALHLLTGALQLTGTNSYSGSTILEDGSTLNVTTANVSTGNANIVAAGGTVLFDQATSGTYAGVISDGPEDGGSTILPGSLVKEDSTGANGGNLTLSAVQTYTGATNVEAGTLTLGAANAIASSSGLTLGRVGGGATAALVLGADNRLQALSSSPGDTTSVQLGTNTLTLDQASGSTSTFGGTISGAGALVMAGAGTFTVAGANSYTGGTTVSAGTLDVTGAGTLGTGNITVSGGALSIASAGNLAGASVTLDGGTLATLADAIQLGNVSLDTGGAIAVGTGTTILSSSLTGTGDLVVFGPGTLVLTGTNSYTGGTTIASGTLEIGAGTVAGPIVDNGTLLFEVASDGTHAGDISGTGNLVKDGAGALTLSGVLTYTGTTSILAGELAVASLANAGTLSNAGALVATGHLINTGAIVGGGSLVETGLLTNSGSIAGTVTVAGQGLQGSSGAALDNRAGGTITGGSVGVLVSADNALITNRGAIVATAANGVGISFTGASGTIDNFGVISGGTNGAAIQFADGTNELIMESGSLLTGAANGGTGTNILVLNGTAMLSNAQVVGFQTVDFAGTNSTIDASTTVANASIATGTTLSNQGTLTGTFTVALAGAVTNNGTIETTGTSGNSGNFVNASTGTLTNGSSFANTGTLTNNGTITTVGGQLTSSGSFINSGTVTSDGIGLTSSGSVSNGGTITGGNTGVSLTSGGTLTNDAGGFIKGGTYGVVVGSGAAVVNAGTILDDAIAGASLGSGASFSNAATGLVKGTTGIIFAGTGASFTNAGTIDGSGGVAVDFKGGANTLTLDTGTVLVGTIEGEGGAGTINLTGTGTLANAIEGFGTGSKLAITTGADWTASGNWTIANVTNSGTLQPGTPGKGLHLIGKFTQSPTGTLRVLLDDASNAGSELTVTGAAVLAGSVVVVPSGQFLTAKTYTIVSATGGVSGGFANATTASPLLAPTLSYDADDAMVTLAQLSVASPPASPPSSPPTSPPASPPPAAPPALVETQNQHAAAVAFDAGLVSNPTGFNTAIRGLDQLDAAGVKTSLDHLSGESHASLSTTALQTSTLFADQFMQQGVLTRLGASGSASGQSAMAAGGRQELARLDGGTDDPVANIDRPWGVWSSGYGQTGQVSGDGNTHRLDETIAGGAVGADYKLTPALRVGAGLGYGGTTFSLDDGGGRGQVDHTQVALYSSYTAGPAYIGGTLGFAYGDATTTRNVSLPGRPAQASGHTTDTQILGEVEAGYGLNLGTVTVTPFVGMSFGTVDQDGFTESGAGALDLRVVQQSQSSVKSRLGTRLTADLPFGAAIVSTDLSIGWAHEFAPTGRSTLAAFTGAPGAGFQVAGAKLPGDSALVGFGLATALFANTSIYVHYDGDLASGATSNAVTGGFRWSW